MNPPLEPGAPALAAVLAYHERTKHRFERYAAGPETLDWSAQPEPFRWYEGTPRIRLPLAADGLATPYAALGQPGGVPPRPFSLENLALLLELSLGLSAWKEYGPDRWALRCNPSSGNLHPTEGYVLCRGVADLADGIYHYLSRDHVLEQRAPLGPEPGPEPRVCVALSSIHWREAWKYGERAFRYCQLDTGHAIGALRYAAAALGWRVRGVEGLGSAGLAAMLGLDRRGDFLGVEEEEPELLLELLADTDPSPAAPDFAVPPEAWRGQANRLDPHPMYHWPVIDEVAEASRAPAAVAEAPGPAPAAYPPLPGLDTTPAAALIRQRRSAQHFDRKQTMGSAAFYRLLDALLPRADTAPFDAWNAAPRLHPVLFVHRVEGLEPGLYALPRRAGIETDLRAAFKPDFEWTRPAGCPGHLPLFRLVAGDCAKVSRAINCHQAIGADSSFALGMLAEFGASLAETPWAYRRLYWEAGLLGQALYLEAEALGVRGTGIGCYFDDVFHQLLGLEGPAFQSLYHFTVGFPLVDTRILTLPPYAGRDPTPGG